MKKTLILLFLPIMILVSSVYAEAIDPTNIPIKPANQQMAEVMEGIGDATSSFFEVVEEKSISLLDLGLAFIGNPDAEKKIIDAINNDPTISAETKRVSIQEFKEMIKTLQKIYDDARDEEGAVDMNKVMISVTKERVKANDALAKSMLRSLSVATEIYVTSNNGQYPESISDLTEANPPYTNIAYCGETEDGFKYECDFSSDKYEFKATPIEIGKTGTTIFTISTGGVLSP